MVILTAPLSLDVLIEISINGEIDLVTVIIPVLICLILHTYVHQYVELNESILHQFFFFDRDLTAYLTFVVFSKYLLFSY